ncbi:SDR family NAD(P)-dependent oxidoreductase, partial [Corynebacterium sanguinis]
TGAGRGIGKATAELLLARGWTVGVYGKSDNVSWASEYANAISGTLDVTDPEQWQSAVAEFTDRAGSLDVLVNNAGILYATAFEDGTYELDSSLIDVNVKGVLYGLRAAFPYLRKSRGQVINLCSASAIYGTPDMATYSATKFAMRGITEALEVEWELYGIDVKSVWPLYADTGMLDGVETDGTKRGIHLTAKDVARDVAKAIEHRQRLITTVHFPSGAQARRMYWAAAFAPPFIVRYANARFTTTRKVGF